jgi:ASC-1-like (ASCH) protein
MTHTMKLSEPYYSLVKQNKKTVEIRVNDEKRQKLKIKNTIIFTKQDGSGKFTRKIKNLVISKNFETSIRSATLKKCMPNIKKIKEAVNIYHSFPNYKENAKKYGVIAIYLK